MIIFPRRVFAVGDKRYECDVAFIDDKIVVSVEFKFSPTGTFADFWVSGRHGENQLNLVLRFQAALPSAGLDGDSLSKPVRDQYLELVKLAIPQAEHFYVSTLRPLAVASMELGGIPESIDPPTPEMRKTLAWVHLALHGEGGNLEQDGAPVAVRTALQYKLIKSFGFRAATPLIAAYEGVTPVAIDRRLFMAREAKYLNKMSDVEAIQN
jgi:hypothetical protein